jgi:hypothetical protein
MAGDVKASWGDRLRLFLRRAAEVALPTAGAVVLALSGTVSGHVGLAGHEPTANAVLAVAGGALLLIGAILIARRTIPLERLAAEVPGLRRRAELGGAALLRLMQAELRVLAQRTRYASNERISLYREEADGFTLLARYSARPAFAQSLGRPVLPCEEGVIGMAWALGSAEENQLPRPGNGEPPNQRWVDAQVERCKMPAGAVAGLTMRSQAYIAFRIASDDPKGQGAIVFESTTSLDDLGQTSAGPLLRAAELEEPVKEASGRLTRFLIESRPLGRAEIRELLGAQQGPNETTQAADSSA